MPLSVASGLRRIIRPEKHTDFRNRLRLRLGLGLRTVRASRGLWDRSPASARAPAFAYEPGHSPGEFQVSALIHTFGNVSSKGEESLRETSSYFRMAVLGAVLPRLLCAAAAFAAPAVAQRPGATASPAVAAPAGDILARPLPGAPPLDPAVAKRLRAAWKKRPADYRPRTRHLPPTARRSTPTGCSSSRAPTCCSTPTTR